MRRSQRAGDGDGVGSREVMVEGGDYIVKEISYECVVRERSF